MVHLSYNLLKCILFPFLIEGVRIKTNNKVFQHAAAGDGINLMTDLYAFEDFLATHVELKYGSRAGWSFLKWPVPFSF